MKNKDKHIKARDLEDVIYIIGGHWRGAILACLCEKDRRFNELKRELGKVTSRVLSKELKYLEMNKLIIRLDNNTRRTIGIYQITEHGRSLEPVVKHVHEWAQKHRKMIS